MAKQIYQFLGLTAWKKQQKQITKKDEWVVLVFNVFLETERVEKSISMYI